MSNPQHDRSMYFSNPWAIGFKISVVSILLCLIFTRVEWRRTYEIARTVSPAVLGACLLLNLFSVLVASARWHVLLSDFRLGQLLRFSFIGQYYSVLFSGQGTGEVIKTLWLGADQKDTGRVAASVMVDKIIGFLALIAVAVTGIFLSAKKISPAPVYYGSALMALAFFLFCLFSRFSFFYKFFLSAADVGQKIFPLFAGLLGFATRFLESWRVFSRDTAVLRKVFVIGIVYQLLGILVAYGLSESLGLGISYWNWCWIVAVLAGALLLPVTVAGIGVREVTLIGLLGNFGVLPEKAFAFSVLLFFVQLFSALAGGLLHFRDIQSGSLRR